jgi:hypothetical protein
MASQSRRPYSFMVTVSITPNLTPYNLVDTYRGPVASISGLRASSKANVLTLKTQSLLPASQYYVTSKKGIKCACVTMATSCLISLTCIQSEGSKKLLRRISAYDLVCFQATELNGCGFIWYRSTGV